MTETTLPTRTKNTIQRILDKLDQAGFYFSLEEPGHWAREKPEVHENLRVWIASPLLMELAEALAVESYTYVADRMCRRGSTGTRDRERQLEIGSMKRPSDDDLAEYWLTTVNGVDFCTWTTPILDDRPELKERIDQAVANSNRLTRSDLTHGSIQLSALGMTYGGCYHGNLWDKGARISMADFEEWAGKDRPRSIADVPLFAAKQRIKFDLDRAKHARSAAELRMAEAIRESDALRDQLLAVEAEREALAAE